MEISQELDRIDAQCRDSFDSRRTIKSFAEYLNDFVAAPGRHLRTSPQYCLDMIRSFGHEEAERIGLKDRRWLVFDAAFDPALEPLVGQERVQNALVRQLQQFAHRGRPDKLVLLHGPNGSSKSTIVELLMAGLEHYSKSDAGAVYRLNWMFAERDERSGKIGLTADSDDPLVLDSYAYLKPEDIAARLPCEMRDSPIFLIPAEERAAFLESLAEKGEHQEVLSSLNYDYFLHGDLCPKCKKIYDALLAGYRGDWREVLRHIQVERYYISKRYRSCAISIEPQGNVDAGTRPLSYEPSVHLPTSLQGLSLSEALGDLIDANHGVVEYSDFLKRPLETNKYLLTTSEKGTVHLQGYTGFLDLLMVGTANEKHLSLFKRGTDFPSFKGRMELVSVPYLLRYSTEATLYNRRLTQHSRDRHVTPHVATVAALWAVLTRLRRPSAKNHPPELAPLVARLSPMEKAMLYDHDEVQLQLKDVERKLLLSNVRALRDEFDDAETEFEGIPGAEYEGRRGASPREMLGLLADAAESKKYSCLTPMAVFDELEKLVKDASLYEFLRLPVDNGYNDCLRFIEDVKEHYLDLVVQEVYQGIGLVEEQEYERVFHDYFHHVKSFDLGEKMYVASRGEYVEPSEDLMGRIEGLMNINEPIDVYRSNLITKIAAYSIDHPDEPIQYDALFPDIYGTLKQSYFQERDRILQRVEHNILRHGTDEFQYLSETDQAQVMDTLERMASEHGYCACCAKDVIAFVLHHRGT